MAKRTSREQILFDVRRAHPGLAHELTQGPTEEQLGVIRKGLFRVKRRGFNEKWIGALTHDLLQAKALSPEHLPEFMSNVGNIADSGQDPTLHTAVVTSSLLTGAIRPHHVSNFFSLVQDTFGAINQQGNSYTPVATELVQAFAKRKIRYEHLQLILPFITHVAARGENPLRPTQRLLTAVVERRISTAHLAALLDQIRTLSTPAPSKGVWRKITSLWPFQSNRSPSKLVDHAVRALKTVPPAQVITRQKRIHTAGLFPTSTRLKRGS